MPSNVIGYSEQHEGVKDDLDVRGLVAAKQRICRDSRCHCEDEYADRNPTPILKTCEPRRKVLSLEVRGGSLLQFDLVSELRVLRRRCCRLCEANMATLALYPLVPGLAPIQRAPHSPPKATPPQPPCHLSVQHELPHALSIYIRDVYSRSSSCSVNLIP